MVAVVKLSSGVVSTKIMRGKRNVFVNPLDGTGIAVMCDPNDAAGGGDDTNVPKILVYTSTTGAMTTWTLRATITPTVGPSASVPNCTGAIFPDGSIAVAWIASDGTVRYRKVTTGTWAVSAEETASAAISSGTVRDVDMDVNAQGAILMAIFYTTTINGQYGNYRLHVRTTANVWGVIETNILHPGNPVKTWAWDITCTWIGGAVNTARTFAVAYSSTTDLQDWGVRTIVGKTSELTITAIAGKTTVGTSFSTDTVKVGKDTTFTYKPRETFLFKDEYTNSVTLGCINNSGVIQFYVTRFTYDGTTVVQTIPPSGQSSTIQGAPSAGVSVTYGPQAINFYFSGYKDGTSRIYNFVRRIIGGNTLSPAASPREYVPDSIDNGRTWRIFGGSGNRSGTYGWHHPLMFIAATTSTTISFYVEKSWDPPIGVSNAATPVYPIGGVSITDATPILQTLPVLGTYDPPQSKVRMFYEFAHDVGFSVGHILWESTEWQGAGTEAQFTSQSTGVTSKVCQDTTPDAFALGSGPWYWRAGYYNEFGKYSVYGTTVQFTVAHPPSAYNLSPDNGALVLFGNGDIIFKWEFSDPWVNDQQTAYQIQVYDPGTSTTLHDSGKVLSASHQHIQAILIANAEKSLQWRVQVWDVDDTPGGFSPYEDFYLAIGPIVTPTAPVSGATVTQPNPVITATVDTNGGRTITQYRITITQGSKTLHSSAWVESNIADAGTLTYAPSIQKLRLENLQNYTLRVEVKDSLGLFGSYALPFSTTWTPPAAPSAQAVSTTSYNVINQGYNNVTWTETSRDVDFIQFNVYRKDDFIDPTTLTVLQAGEWKLINTTYDILTTYAYKDYYAPSGYKVSYQVTQVADRFGTMAESTMTGGTVVYPASDGYWLIDPNAPDVASTAFRLSIVTSDSFIDEYEEETYHIMGRGRYVEKGDRLGYSGTLAAQIRDDVNYSARQKRKRLETIRAENREMFLRNPFGDMFRVSVGNMSIDRIAGVGLSEFVDVSIPYVEVGALS